MKKLTEEHHHIINRINVISQEVAKLQAEWTDLERQLQNVDGKSIEWINEAYGLLPKDSRLGRDYGKILVHHLGI